MANPARKKRISDEGVSRILSDVSVKLGEGFSGKAETKLTETLEEYSLTPESEALVVSMLSYALETLGQYDRALEVIDRYDDEKVLEQLTPETQIVAVNQLAISLSNKNDNPKAVNLLNYSLEKAQSENLVSLLGPTYVALARVYRKLNEYPIARDFARQGLSNYREQGDWRGMAGFRKRM